MNTSAHEFCPVVAANGNLYFISTREGGIKATGNAGPHNVWRAHPIDKSAGAWQPMQHLPAPINSPQYEYGPSITPDGKWMFFTSHRTGNADIYRVPIAAIQRLSVRRP